jgi:DNA-binding response OmpR family regulator
LKADVLVVDDEQPVRELIARCLQRAGFTVQQAASGQEALRLARLTAPGLIVLDLGLPDITGLDVCAAVKNDSGIAETPIVILTGDRQQGQSIVCLESGADDYLNKPCDLAELTARVKAVLRRANPPSKMRELMNLDGLTVDPARRVAFVEDRPVENLTPKEFDILCLLLQSRPDVLSREFLARKVWGDEAVAAESRTLDVHIRRLRQKLGEKAAARLVTVPGRGHRFL